MTQEDLAEFSSLSVNFISKIERTGNQNISIQKLDAIAKALQTSVITLIDESSKQFPSIDCIDTTADTIDFSTHIVFDMYYNPYDPDPHINEPIDWI